LIYDSEEPINEDYTFSDVAYVCANVLARLKDLLNIDEDPVEVEGFNLSKKLELFFFSKDVYFAFFLKL